MILELRQLIIIFKEWIFLFTKTKNCSSPTRYFSGSTTGYYIHSSNNNNNRKDAHQLNLLNTKKNTLYLVESNRIKIPPIKNHTIIKSIVTIKFLRHGSNSHFWTRVMISISRLQIFIKTNFFCNTQGLCRPPPPSHPHASWAPN